MGASFCISGKLYPILAFLSFFFFIYSVSNWELREISTLELNSSNMFSIPTIVSPPPTFFFVLVGTSLGPLSVFYVPL
jgi:hypothetical protein